GGEARAKGNNERGQIWRVGVTSPERVDNIQKVVWLQNKAIATSGDYFNYYEMDGKRYSHTIDPQTGKPVTHKLASVTVVSDNCMTADGFATAIDVMGPERGFQFAAERKLPVFMIVREGEIFVEKMTPEFSEMLKTKK
ncbi:MAG: FAD:protein FMN transferase, partial [Calditrichaeota bacterium]|nr:FAD:protein FMN transferase [Calditrichota bacterium]